MNTPTATVQPETVNLFDMLNNSAQDITTAPETPRPAVPPEPVASQPLAPANPPNTGSSAPSAYREPPPRRVLEQDPELAQARVEAIAPVQDLPGGVFVSLSLSIWTASKKLDPMAVQVGDADRRAFRTQKDLVRREELKTIRRCATEATQLLRYRALPFDLRGVYFIPSGLIESVTDRLSSLETEFFMSARSFASRYDQMRADAITRLGEHFNPDDYPVDILSRFDWRLKLFNFSGPNTSLQAVSPQLYRQAQNAFNQDIQEFRANASALLRERFSEAVSHLVERLTPAPDGTRKIFRDSAVGNLREFLADFEALNIANDSELRAQVERTRSLLSGVSPEHLRGADFLATQVRNQLATVQESVSGMLENVPKRRIRFQEPVQ